MKTPTSPAVLCRACGEVCDREQLDPCAAACPACGSRQLAAEPDVDPQLAAAAPDLLEALRLIVDRSVIGAPRNPFGHIAREAIAKATGKGGPA